MLYEKDVTVKGLEIIKKAERVYLEAYTAVLLVEKDVLVSGGMGKYRKTRL
jgi:diphthine synthase